MLIVPLLGCTAPDPSGDTAAVPTPGVVVLAGGGSEGDDGDPEAWSARLYAALLEGGDVTGDGRVRVGVLSTAEESDWLPGYFEGLGADEAVNVRVSTRSQADASSVASSLADFDAVFLKGGDQGEYYDLWNDTALDAALLALRARGGGIGGTSAGAMSQAEWAFAGGEDLVSADVLQDARTPYLDDASDGGSGVHGDFLGTVPGVVIDTHFTVRGRLGRLCGILARVVDEHAPAGLLGIGLDEQTGVVLRGTAAEVIGVGAVSLVDPSEASAPVRESGLPLGWSGLRLSRLTDGARFDLANPGAAEAPPGAEVVAWDGSAGEADGEWYADGDWLPHEERFAVVVDRSPEPFATRAGTDLPVLSDGIGVLDAHDADRRGANEEALFRALHDHVGHTGFLVGEGGSLQRAEAEPSQVAAIDNPESDEPATATLVVDSTAVTARALAPLPSPSDTGDGSLHAATLLGLRLHVLYTPVAGESYDTVTRSVVAE
ncbi:MAG: cyanophycinase [Deltaproteobacteria bacterium]|nr:cyanophycinase [Deltaproteobacteria bacterium]